MSAPAQPPGVRLFLDLGDLFTKGLAIRSRNIHFFEFPSVISRRLLDATSGEDSLQLNRARPLPRLPDFKPGRYPRARSYAGATRVRQDFRPASNARFAGWQAARHGADRQILGHDPSTENIDALVHKALMSIPFRLQSVEIIFIVDAGRKAANVVQYATGGPRRIRFLTWNFDEQRPHRLEATLDTRIVDAPDCTRAAVPSALARRFDSFLFIDIGYLRTKLTIASATACEFREQLEATGVSDGVLRLLRDEQEHGLIEDELAVVEALRRSRRTIQVAGRQFMIARTLAASMQPIAEDVTRAARRLIVQYQERQGRLCRAVVLHGGGAALLGDALERGLRAADIGIQAVWIPGEQSSFLLGGGREVYRRASAVQNAS